MRDNSPILSAGIKISWNAVLADALHMESLRGAAYDLPMFKSVATLPMRLIAALHMRNLWD
jgi:hypothetical protein